MISSFQASSLVQYRKTLRFNLEIDKSFFFFFVLLLRVKVNPIIVYLLTLSSVRVKVIQSSSDGLFNKLNRIFVS